MHERLKPIARRMLEISYQHQHNHVAGCLSALPIIWEVFKNEITKGGRFDFVLSKGHAAAALYAVLEASGFSPDVSKIHPDRDPANGIPCTTGSLGHGLPLAAGMALAMKARKEDRRVYVLLGDGECQEGTTWEALWFARRMRLFDWLKVIVDANQWQALERTVSPVEDLERIYPVRYSRVRKGAGLSIFDGEPWHVHEFTAEEYRKAMEELA